MDLDEETSCDSSPATSTATGANEVDKVFLLFLLFLYFLACPMFEYHYDRKCLALIFCFIAH